MQTLNKDKNFLACMYQALVFAHTSNAVRGHSPKTRFCFEKLETLAEEWGEGIARSILFFFFLS